MTKWTKIKEYRAYNYHMQSSAAEVFGYSGKAVPRLGPPADFKAYTKPLTEESLYPEVPGMRDRAYRQMLYRKWSAVAAELVIRHPACPDPIQVTFDPPAKWNAYGKSINGRFALLVPDTRFKVEGPRSGRLGAGFHMPILVDYWPGEEAARLFFVGAWMTYLAHEATELVTFKRSGGARDVGYDVMPYPDRDRVLNVHDTCGGRTRLYTDHWQRMRSVMHNKAQGDFGETRKDNPHPLQVVLECAIGQEAVQLAATSLINGARELEPLVEAEVMRLRRQPPQPKAVTYDDGSIPF